MYEMCDFLEVVRVNGGPAGELDLVTGVLALQFHPQQIGTHARHFNLL